MYHHHTLDAMLTQAHQADVMRQARLDRLARVAGQSHGRTARSDVRDKVVLAVFALLVVLVALAAF